MHTQSHPGVLDAKVGYFDPKSAKVLPEQIGTKPAKVGHLAANLLKYVPKKKKKKVHHRGSNPRSIAIFGPFSHAATPFSR